MVFYMVASLVKACALISMLLFSVGFLGSNPNKS